MGLLRNICEMFRSNTVWKKTMMNMNGSTVRVERRESKLFNGVVLRTGMVEGSEFEIFMTDTEAARTAHALLDAIKAKDSVPNSMGTLQ